MNLQKYAMHFGTYMGIFWIIKFAFFPLGFTNTFFNFLFMALTLGVPYLGYRYAKLFRDKVCGGTIAFLPTWIFLIFMYMFAALLAAVGHFVYFRFMDNGFIVDQIQANADFLAVEMPQLTDLNSMMSESMDILRGMTPIEITMQLLSTNFMFCSILSLLTAPFVVRKSSTLPPTPGI